MMLALLAAATISYPATLIRVVDGDTLRVSIARFPAPFDPIDVRVYGLDAPEHAMPPAQTVCEVAMGRASEAFAKTLAQPGDRITVIYSRGRNDRYGRLLGRVRLADGRDWSDAMISAGMARAYGVGGDLHKAPWCADPDPSLEIPH